MYIKTTISIKISDAKSYYLHFSDYYPHLGCCALKITTTVLSDLFQVSFVVASNPL